MGIVEITRTIRAPVDQVWSALTDADSMGAWMGEGQVESLDLRTGGRYAIFGGSTTGTFNLIEPPRRLAYSWRQGEWPEAWADSLVAWELSPTPEGTELRLRHSGFPNEAERTAHEQGWEDYFLVPLQASLEGSG